MQAINSFFTAINDWFVALFASIGDAFVALCATVFKPVLILFFGPINKFLSPIYQPWATITAIGLFLGTMIWVGFVLKESYVNMGRPNKAWYSDLRIWTACSMLPHVFVYFYFY
jgi:hypothetical protein